MENYGTPSTTKNRWLIPTLREFSNLCLRIRKNVYIFFVLAGVAATVNNRVLLTGGSYETGVGRR